MRLDPEKHADYATLVLVADGEAAPARTAAVNRHLENCLDCRTRAEALRNTSNEFGAARKELLAYEIASAAASRASLIAHLSVAAGRKRSLVERISNAALPLLGRWSLTAATAAIAVAAVVSFSVYNPGLAGRKAKTSMPKAAGSPAQAENTGATAGPAAANVPAAKADSHPQTEPAANTAKTTVADASGISLDDSEVLARVALHRLGEDGSEVEYRVLPGRVLSVSGLVASETRKQSLSTALAAIPHVRSNIHTFAEVASTSSPAQSPAAGGAPAAVAVPVFRNLLEARFSNPGPRAAFVSSVLDESQRASTEAWAIGLLLRRYREQDVAQLGASSRSALDQLIRDHIGELSDAIQLTALRLNPLIATPASIAAPDAQPLPWRRSLSLAAQRTLGLHVELQEALSASSASLSEEQLGTNIASDLPWLRTALTALLQRKPDFAPEHGLATKK